MSSMLPFVGQTLLLAVLITMLLGRFVKDKRKRIGIVVGGLVLGIFLPVFGLSVAQWVRSVVGDLSVVTMIIFSNILTQRLFNITLVDDATKKTLLPGVILVGIVFYPLALGMSAFDPYQLGYSPALMSALLCLTSIVAWFKSVRSLAVILLMPILAFNLHMLESFNLWDYLLDPIVFVYAVVQIVLNVQYIRFKKVGHH